MNTSASRQPPHWISAIADCNGLELSPCCVGGFANGLDMIEPCEPDEAHFWTVYGHRSRGGVIAFEDFPDHKAARRFALRLLRSHPHLRHYGLDDRGCGPPPQGGAL